MQISANHSSAENVITYADCIPHVNMAVFTSDEREELINLVKKYLILWQTEQSSYDKQGPQDACFQKITKDLDETLGML